MKNEISNDENECDISENGIVIHPQKGKYLKIQKGEKIYYLDRTKYDISSYILYNNFVIRLMMLLDITKLNKLEKEFEKYDNGIAKEKFIEYISFLF